MKNSARYFSILIVLLFSGAAAAQVLNQAATSDSCAASKELPNFGCVSPTIYRGAQPTEEGVRELARRGIKVIIDLRGADKNVQIEEGWARSAGLRFINIPLNNWKEPKNAEINQIMALLESSKNQPVFIHCRRGADRTGMVIAVYRMKHDGWTADRAFREAKSFHFAWWQFSMKHYIQDFYKKSGKRDPENSQ